jgi:hypothetical protein
MGNYYATYLKSFIILYMLLDSRKIEEETISEFRIYINYQDQSQEPSHNNQAGQWRGRQFWRTQTTFNPTVLPFSSP